MNKTFYINPLLVDEYERKRSEMINKFLLYETTFTIAIIIFLLLQKNPTLGIIIFSAFYVLTLSIMLKARKSTGHRTIEIQIKNDVICKKFNTHKNGKTQSLKFEEIGKIKKDNMGLDFFKRPPKFVKQKEMQAFLNIPNTLDQFDLVERYILDNNPNVELEGF